MRLSLIGTGGTIASRQTRAGVVAQIPAAELLRTVSHRLPVDTEVATADVGVRGSFALRLEDMRQIALAAIAATEGDRAADGVVVLHGTDSMEETSFLTDLLYDGSRPIVFTGAQRANDAPNGDAEANMTLAIETALDPAARDQGVLVAFHGRLWHARGVRKVHTEHLEGFADPNGEPVVLGQPGRRRRSAIPLARQALAAGDLPRVEVVAAVPGGDGGALRAAADRGAGAVVLQALGIGNAGPGDTEAVAELVGRGIPVLITSRVAGGPVRPVYGNGGGSDLARNGAVFATDLSPWQARILAAVALAIRPNDPTEAISGWLGSIER